jgi:hypothetical protein
MSVALRFGAMVMLAVSAWCFAAGKEAEAKEEKPAIELGGYVTVDYTKDLSEDADPFFGIGEVDLSANVNISAEVVASITVMTYDRLDEMWIDQAMVAYTPSLIPVEFLFGQQTMNHGLLTTRMISDPALLEDVELSCPSMIVNGSFRDRFKGGIGFTMLPKYDDLGLDTTYLYSGVVNIDALLQNESVIRLSSLTNKNVFDIDVAGTVNYWKLALDFEGLYTIAPKDSMRASGFYTGLQYNLSDHIACAVRADGLSDALTNFKNMDMRMGGGVNIMIKDGIFCALEFAQRRPFEGDAVNEIAFEVGLEQTIQLPGFQRKTLTRE